MAWQDTAGKLNNMPVYFPYKIQDDAQANTSEVRTIILVGGTKAIEDLFILGLLIGRDM